MAIHERHTPSSGGSCLQLRSPRFRWPLLLAASVAAGLAVAAAASAQTAARATSSELTAAPLSADAEGIEEQSVPVASRPVWQARPTRGSQAPATRSTIPTSAPAVRKPVTTAPQSSVPGVRTASAATRTARSRVRSTAAYEDVPVPSAAVPGRAQYVPSPLPPPPDAMVYDQGMIVDGGCADGTCGLADCGTCCDTCDPCCDVYTPCAPSQGRLWVEAEYLQWWTSGFSAPPLVTTGPGTDTIAQAGVIGRPGTEILYGGSDLVDGSISGARIEAGFWTGPACRMAVQGSYMAIGNKSQTFAASGADYAVLARPFFDVAPNVGAEAVSSVVYPGVRNGAIVVDASSEFHAIEAMLRPALVTECGFRIDGLFGYRHARLLEELTISESLQLLSPPVQQGTTIDAYDRFETDNVFNGGQLGVSTEVRNGRWTFEMLLKLALGSTTADVTIDGQQVTTIPGPPQDVNIVDGSLFAQRTNSGVYSDSQFAVMPEIGATLGWNVTHRLRVQVGYTFLYLSRVARPGDQIDREVNSTLPPFDPTGTFAGAERPEVQFQWSDFWAQGINVGLHYQF